LERAGLPGAPLNLEENRPTTIGDLTVLHRKFTDTITCGRVGTLMPAWSTEQGGSLNEFQIQQLVALITGTMPGFSLEDNPDPNRISEEGWARALEVANHAAEFDPPKELAEAITANNTTLLLNDATGLAEDAVLRIDDEPEEEGYELVLVTAVADERNEIDVERGASGTEAVDHEEGAQCPRTHRAAYRPGNRRDRHAAVRAAPRRDRRRGSNLWLYRAPPRFPWVTISSISMASAIRTGRNAGASTTLQLDKHRLTTPQHAHAGATASSTATTMRSPTPT
jgi:hypothetical protein